MVNDSISLEFLVVTSHDFDQKNIGIIFSSKEKSKALKDNINCVMLVFHTFCKYTKRK